jgi:alpha,alpha-trehalase
MRCGRNATFSIQFSSLFWLVSFFLFKPLGAQKAISAEPYIAEAQKYYIANWKKSVRSVTYDSADFIGLPNPYSTPTLSGNQMFREMYYWDSYFINCGLLTYGNQPQRDGDATPDEKDAIQQAINNCNNLIYLVNRFGFIPNANRFSMTNRSQPPLLAAMVTDIFDVTGDTAWLRIALKALEKEHHWWMENRSLGLTPQEYQGIHGANRYPSALRLNHYGNNATDAFLLRFAQFLKGRLGPGFDSIYSELNRDTLISREGKKQGKGILLSDHLLAEAESGWDFTTRFNARCLFIAPLDLNCLLYLSEKTLANGYKTLKEHKKSREWRQRSNLRKALINKLFYDKHTGWYWDYDIAKRVIHFNHNAAQFMPYFVGLARHNSRNKTALARLSNTYIGKFGVYPCLPLSKDSSAIAANRVFWKTQWDSPNAWPPLTHFAAQAIRNYSNGQGQLTNLMLNMKRNQLILSFMESVEVQFAITQKFWEKYNVDYGTLQVVNEYPMPDFFGWTAGVYMEYHFEFARP